MLACGLGLKREQLGIWDHAAVSGTADVISPSWFVGVILAWRYLNERINVMNDAAPTHGNAQDPQDDPKK